MGHLDKSLHSLKNDCGKGDRNIIRIRLGKVQNKVVSSGHTRATKGLKSQQLSAMVAYSRPAQNEANQYSAEKKGGSFP